MQNHRPVAALISACLTSGLVLVGTAPQGEACRRHYVPRDTRPAFAKVNGRWEVRLDTRSRWYRFQGSNLQLQGVYVYTRDEGLARFVKAQGGSTAFWKAVQQTAQRFTCADVMLGQDLARVEKAVGQAVLAAYRKATRRRVAAPDIMLGIHVSYQVTCSPPARRAP